MWRRGTDAWRDVRALLPAVGAGWISYCGLILLLCSPAIRVFDAGWLPYTAGFQPIADFLGSTTWFGDGPDSDSTIAATWIYLGLAAIACASWGWAVQTARTLAPPSPAAIIALTALLATPLLVAPGLTSDDLYLYNAYGRTIAVHGANPVLSAPAAFPWDPHLEWVHWKELPSAYGPVWLLLSASLSRLAGDSVTASVIAYRLAGLVLHLVAVGLLWRALRRHRPAVALPATLFYAWNPLVLHEVVANAHNDVLVALFAIPLVAAAMHAQWSRAAVWAACAVMVKPFAVVLVPGIVRTLWQSEGKDRYRQLALAAGVGAAAMLALSLPLWSGHALLSNILRNPAASAYTNSLWELAAGPDAAVGHLPHIDLVRALAFLGGAAWILLRATPTGNVAQVAVRVWLVFCLTAGWVWPWYFVPALALAPLAGAVELRLASALTVGGLLFWAAWPYRGVGAMPQWYEWRSVLLFGPAIVTAFATPALGLVGALARRRRAVAPEHDTAASGSQVAA